MRKGEGRNGMDKIESDWGLLGTAVFHCVSFERAGWLAGCVGVC